MPSISTRYPGVFIDSNSLTGGFEATVNATLDRIHETKSGIQLLRRIASAAVDGKVVTIREVTHQSETFAKATETQQAIAREKGISSDALARNESTKPLLARRAQGSSAMVHWNPENAVNLDDKGRPLDLNGNQDENFVVLAHELHHARKMLTGTSNAGCGDRHRGVLTPAGREERSAVRLENRIRREHMLRLRTQYNKVGKKLQVATDAPHPPAAGDDVPRRPPENAMPGPAGLAAPGRSRPSLFGSTVGNGTKPILSSAAQAQHPIAQAERTAGAGFARDDS